MSIQSDIEAGIVTLANLAISGLVVAKGPVSGARAEGATRLVSVRKTGSAYARAEFGQQVVSELFAVTLYWEPSISRDTCGSEFETFAETVRQNSTLGLAASQPSVERAYIQTTQWGEPVDGHFRTLLAALVVERVE